MDQMHKATMIPEIPLIPFNTAISNNNNNTSSSSGSNIIRNQNMNNQIILPIEVALSYTNGIYFKLVNNLYFNIVLLFNLFIYFKYLYIIYTSM